MTVIFLKSSLNLTTFRKPWSPRSSWISPSPPVLWHFVFYLCDGPYSYGPMSVNYMYAWVIYICKLYEFLRIRIIYLILYLTLSPWHLPVHKMRTQFYCCFKWVGVGSSGPGPFYSWVFRAEKRYLRFAFISKILLLTDWTIQELTIWVGLMQRAWIPVLLGAKPGRTTPSHQRSLDSSSWL